MRFRAFLQDTSQTEAAKADRELKEVVKEIEVITFPSEDEIDKQLAELTDAKSETIALKDRLKECSRNLTALKSSMLRCLKGEAPVENLPTADQSVVSDISAASDGLDNEITSLDLKVKDDVILSTLRETHKELLDRKNCASNRAIFFGRRSDLCTLNALKRCKKQCDTGSISRKGSALREEYLTEDFRNKINDEVKFLGLNYLQIVVDGHTEQHLLISIPRQVAPTFPLVLCKSSLCCSDVPRGCSRLDQEFPRSSFREQIYVH